jgi:hypothetical protein
MKTFAAFVSEALSAGWGFVLADGRDVHRSGTTNYGMDHTTLAAQLLSRHDAEITDLLAAGAIRYSYTRGEVCLHYYGGNATTAQHALAFLAANYDRGDVIFLDVIGPPYDTNAANLAQPGRFTNVGSANRVIRQTGGLHTEALLTEHTLDTLDARFPLCGSTLDGRRVTSDVPNTDSIASSLTDYDVLRGVRAVPLALFTQSAGGYSVEEDRRIAELASAIAASRSITPLIVVFDRAEPGPYVLEGGHRFHALCRLKASALPALIVLDAG